MIKTTVYMIDLDNGTLYKVCHGDPDPIKSRKKGKDWEKETTHSVATLFEYALQSNKYALLDEPQFDFWNSVLNPPGIPVTTEHLKDMTLCFIKDGEILMSKETCDNFSSPITSIGCDVEPMGDGILDCYKEAHKLEWKTIDYNSTESTKLDSGNYISFDSKKLYEDEENTDYYEDKGGRSLFRVRNDRVGDGAYCYGMGEWMLIFINDKTIEERVEDGRLKRVSFEDFKKRIKSGFDA